MARTSPGQPHILPLLAGATRGSGPDPEGVESRAATGGAQEGARGERRPGNSNQDRDHFEGVTALLGLPLPAMQRRGVKGTGDTGPWPGAAAEGDGVGPGAYCPGPGTGSPRHCAEKVFFHRWLPPLAYGPNGAQMPHKLTGWSDRLSVSKVTLKIGLTSADLLPDCGPNEKVSQGGK